MGEDMESSVHYADETGCKYDRRRCKVGNSRRGTLRRMFRAGFLCYRKKVNQELR
nr:MAG TPA: hypothetical protein [Bacteriophage sp.]